MSKTLIALVATLAICPAVGLADTLINLEEAAEVRPLELRLNGASSALIYARVCDYCEMLSLTVDNNTKISRGNARLSLEEAARLQDKGASVMFDPGTLRVTRIIFWN